MPCFLPKYDLPEGLPRCAATFLAPPVLNCWTKHNAAAEDLPPQLVTDEEGRDGHRQPVGQGGVDDEPAQQLPLRRVAGEQGCQAELPRAAAARGRGERRSEEHTSE